MASQYWKRVLSRISLDFRLKSSCSFVSIKKFFCKMLQNFWFQPVLKEITLYKYSQFLTTCHYTGCILKECIKNQEASYNFRLSFALSNRPHLNRAYLVTIPFILILAVSSISGLCFDFLNHFYFTEDGAEGQTDMEVEIVI